MDAKTSVDDATNFRASPRLFGSRRGRLIASTATLALAGFALGAAVSRAWSTGHVDDGLVLLMRFMALTKLALIAGLTWLVHWRLGHPASDRLAAAYILPVTAMAVTPGLIWFMTFVIPVAILFHAALLFVLVVGLCDDGLGRHLKGQSSR